MEIKKINMRSTGQFSSLFLDYLDQKADLKKFYSDFPISPDVFLKNAESRAQEFPMASRQILVSAIKAQYGALLTSEETSNNLDRLALKNCVTITTGHQLNIFTGPLYFIYKITTVIKACQELSRKNPELHFVPVFWMASEDHDFEEISYMWLQGRKFVWETDQSGAVGRFDPQSIASLLDEIPGKNGIFRKAYLENETLSGAVRSYVDDLFGKEGLVIIDGDNRDLKALLSDVIRDELMDGISGKAAQAQTSKLEKLGYQSQVYPRDINFFFLQDSLRSRIVHQNDKYRILETDLEFTREEMLTMAKESPEVFSPNVILRPLYQEIILPNISYVGGPAEVVYWLQLKTIFDHYKVPFPILLPRNFALFIPNHINRKRLKIPLEIEDLFKNQDAVNNAFIESNAKKELGLPIPKKKVEEVFDDILASAVAIDPSLQGLVKAEKVRSVKSIEKIESRMVRGEKRNQSDKLSQLDAVFQFAFPGGTPQERKVNFLTFQHEDADFLEKVLINLDPFDLRYHVMIDD